MAKPKMTTISAKGKSPISFRKGALHRALGVPEDQPIPADKKAAALRGDYGERAKRMATFGFRGALAAGRKTATANRRKAKVGGSGQTSTPRQRGWI